MANRYQIRHKRYMHMVNLFFNINPGLESSMLREWELKSPALFLSIRYNEEIPSLSLVQGGAELSAPLNILPLLNRY